MQKISLVEIIHSFKNRKILVVGDVVLDLYVRGMAERISPEAPVPVLLEKSRQYILGGAGNVAANAAALGAKVVLAGLVGNDVEGGMARKLCRAARIKPLFFAEKDRPTSLKTRATAMRHQILRLDRENVFPMSRAAENKFISVLRGTENFDAVIISDYLKGCLTPKVAEFLRTHFGAKKIIAGLKPQHADFYKNVFAVVMNTKECEVLTGLDASSDSVAAKAAKILVRRFTSSVVLTRGEHGLTVGDKKTRRATHWPAKALQVYDVTGAGDTALAVFALAVVSGGDLKDAADLANRAAGIVVAKEGTATVSPKELKAVVV